MEDFQRLISTPVSAFWAAVVSAAVSALVTYVFRLREHRNKANIDYEFDQKRKHRELIGRYSGRLVAAANTLSNRIWNLYENHDKGWLDVNGNHKNDGCYIRTTVHRFLCVYGLLAQLEREAILLDSRIASKKDFEFLNYASALQSVMTDVKLFDGISYDRSSQKDHFFSDELRRYGRLTWKDGELLDFEGFSNGPAKDGKISSVISFFDGIRPGETRLRWDRLVSFHLMLIAFLNAAGHTRQYSAQDKFLEAASKINNRRVLVNLVASLPSSELASDKGAKMISKALKSLPGEAEGGSSISTGSR